MNTAMPRESAHERTAATPTKLGLIVVLSVVLLAVLGYQLVGPKPSPPALRDALERRRTAKEGSPVEARGVAPNRPVVAPVNPQARPKRWETVSLSDALLWDPFALPPALRLALRKGQPAESAAAPEVDQREQNRRLELQRRREATLAALREKGVGMILATRDGSVATVGSRQVKVGDVLDGLRVVEIGPSGIVLVEEDTP